MSKYDVRNLRVIVGLADLTDAPDGIPELFNDPPRTRHHSDKFAVNRRVKRVIRHKDFNVNKLHNDIAILTLEKPVYDNKGAISVGNCDIGITQLDKQFYAYFVSKAS